MVPVEQKAERLRELLEERLGHLDTLARLLRARAGGGAAVAGGGADGGAAKGNVGIEEKAGAGAGRRPGALFPPPSTSSRRHSDPQTSAVMRHPVVCADGWPQPLPSRGCFSLRQAQALWGGCCLGMREKRDTSCVVTSSIK